MEQFAQHGAIMSPLSGFRHIPEKCAADRASCVQLIFSGISIHPVRGKEERRKRHKMAGQNERRKNAQDDDMEGFTERVLLSMVFDVSQLAENVERLKVQVFSLARERGIEPPPTEK